MAKYAKPTMLKDQLGVTANEIMEDVMALPDNVRQVLLHRSGLSDPHARGLTVAETAHVLGMKRKTVVSLFQAGISMLRPKYLGRPRTPQARLRQAFGL